MIVTKHKYKTLSTKLVINTPESKKQLSALYQSNNWKASKTRDTLANIISRKELITIATDSLVVIDFDCDKAFQQALTFNETLGDENKCNFIVKSTRKGGHFYFSPNENIMPPEGHTKQQILDFLSTDGHNVIAPTSHDESKHIISEPHKKALTTYNSAFNTLVQLIVLQNLPQTARSITLYDQNNRHSDDAKDLAKGYLSNIVTQAQFEEFYNIPNPIPAGGSNEIYLTLSTRLGSDETITKEDYLKVLTQFNDHHNRKSATELKSEITNRMVPTSAHPQGINNLWRYVENKQTNTFTVTHKKYKTKISVYFDFLSSQYIVQYLDQRSEVAMHILGSSTQYIELLEKITLVKKDTIRRKTAEVAAVRAINDYAQPSGYNHKEETFNKAFINSNLTAFYGTKPHNYVQPTELLDLMFYMWKGEYEYLLDITKHRYTTFQFSPVVTFFKGTEGSGKDLSIMLLTAGFTNLPQNLNYQLLMVKHIIWQMEENAVFSEVGSWRPIERDDLLSELKTISGSNGRVTFRDMQKTAQVVPTLIKIWITGNEWLKLHTDPLTQRRIHIVYMPRPLEKASGGIYSSQELENILSEKNILDFYYWLGNEYSLSLNFTIDRYKNSTSRQNTESYENYMENTQSKPDVAAKHLWTQEFIDFEKALALMGVTLQDTDYKYNRAGNLTISLYSLKEVFSRNAGGEIISKTLDRLSSERDGNKRLKFSRNIVEKYVTIYNAPTGLETVSAIEE
jgi:hypothetical protein